jgi:hypothetical protein
MVEIDVKAMALFFQEGGAGCSDNFSKASSTLFPKQLIQIMWRQKTRK